MMTVYSATLCPALSIVMAPKPASTAGKAPASSSTALKALAKTTEGSKAVKKTSKMAAATATGDDTKKKRRKETYSSYIYKGVCDRLNFGIKLTVGNSTQVSTLTSRVNDRA
jgi:hypothetical protein